MLYRSFLIVLNIFNKPCSTHLQYEDHYYHNWRRTSVAQHIWQRWATARDFAKWRAIWQEQCNNDVLPEYSLSVLRSDFGRDYFSQAVGINKYRNTVSFNTSSKIPQKVWGKYFYLTFHLRWCNVSLKLRRPLKTKEMRNLMKKCM